MNSPVERQEQVVESRAVSHKGQRGAVQTGPILVAVDVSWHSHVALLWASRHAACADVPLTVLHVTHDPAEAPGKYNRYSDDPFTPMADRATEMLSEFMAELRENHPDLKQLLEASTIVLQRLPARTIVDEATRLNASLIVVGSRGHVGAPKLIFGSTAQKVVQLAPIPVTVVKASKSS